MTKDAGYTAVIVVLLFVLGFGFVGILTKTSTQPTLHHKYDAVEAENLELAINMADVTIPTAWWIQLEGQVLDAAVYRTTGYPSIRLDATLASGDNPDRQCYTSGYPITPGEQIIFTCYIRTSPEVWPTTWGGARIGIDFYDQIGGGWYRISAIQSDGQHGIYPAEDAGAQAAHFVDWGNSDWVLRQIDFTLPAQIESDGGYYPDHELHVASAFVPWIQVWDDYSSTHPAQAWFADPSLTVNTIPVPPPIIPPGPIIIPVDVDPIPPPPAVPAAENTLMRQLIAQMTLERDYGITSPSVDEPGVDNPWSPMRALLTGLVSSGGLGGGGFPYTFPFVL